MKVLLACIAVVAAAPASAQKAPQCGQFPPEASSLLCLCPAGSPQGQVWGSGPYTADSDICTAATHAGVIGPDGGPVIAERVEGVATHEASLSHGVMTQAWGDYVASFTFAGGREAGSPACGFVVPDLPEQACACGPLADATAGPIWGSGPYTADSDICSAARHAGVLGPEGGTVAILLTGPQDGFAASTANGVQTNAWGAYDGSFLFR